MWPLSGSGRVHCQRSQQYRRDYHVSKRHEGTGIYEYRQRRHHVSRPSDEDAHLRGPTGREETDGNMEKKGQ